MIGILIKPLKKHHKRIYQNKTIKFKDPVILEANKQNKYHLSLIFLPSNQKLIVRLNSINKLLFFYEFLNLLTIVKK